MAMALTGEARMPSLNSVKWLTMTLDTGQMRLTTVTSHTNAWPRRGGH